MEEVVKEVCSSYELSYVSKLPYPVGVQSEHTLLKLILSNLVSNALKYCQKISSIHVSIQASGDNTVAVAIENDGVPIPPDQQQRIFEKDFKGEASKSFGFGLFFVKSIVERMKGSIQLEAGGINKFTLNFPVASTLP